MKTIVALATPKGRSGIAVLRLSGPATRSVITSLCAVHSPRPRLATLCTFKDPKTSEVLDKGLLLFFPGPHSFTGEDVAELHLHGSPSVVRDVLQVILSYEGVDLAEPGEFTRQAFHNGKLDLTEVEGLIDLIDSETKEQRRQALRALEGHIGTFFMDLRQQLLHALAYYEAAIDFVDGEIDEESTDHARQKVEDCLKSIEDELAKGIYPERLKEGYRVALLGAPNAGKSTLLNTLSSRDVAIVSSTPGTTRDLIEVHLDLGGYPVILADTAGLRETTDAVEKEGIDRALRWANSADLNLFLYDSSQGQINPSDLGFSLSHNETLRVANKIDLAPTAHMTDLSISLHTGDGIPLLINAITNKAEKFFTTGTSSVMTRERHRKALEATTEHLKRSLEVSSFDLAAEDLRLATRELGRVTGKVDVEDLLDIIFSDFCIGK